MRILALDPSGSFNEGKGKTGWLILNDWRIETFGQLKASDYTTREEYWAEHRKLITEAECDMVAIEQYILYKHTANTQINSEMETSKLIGYLEMICFEEEIEHTLQLAQHAKARWTDHLLLYKNYITKDKHNHYFINGINVSDHVIDALRHALFCKLKMLKEETKHAATRSV